MTATHPPGPAIPRELVESTIHQRFEQQVERFGARLAVHGGDQAQTYSALNAAANRLAHDLLDRAGAAQQTTALLVAQGAPLVTAMLASSKAGRAFVPLDPSYPEARLRRLLADSDATTVISDDRNFELALRVSGERPLLNLNHLSRAADREGNPQLAVDPARLAYILYTSGSTSEPKGVMQDHRSVLHNMLRHRELFGLSEDDRQTLLYPCGVYGGIRDTFNALLNGAALYHFPIQTSGHIGLADWIERHELTLYCSVATVFRHFARELQGRDRLPSLRLVKLGGEATFRRDVELFQQRLCAHTTLFCGLGSTETGMSRQFRIQRDTPITGTAAPLGYAVPDLDLLLLDEQRRPVPPQTLGEIAFRSRYVTRGYRGRDELNARVLLPDPLDPESRIFLTGDLGLLDEHGCLVHKGRQDSQVKIRGNRVELPEIETALLECPGLLEAVVIAQDNERGEQQLVAYTVPREAPGPSVAALRAELKQRLPAFMVPNVFVSLDEIPLTPNGKIDRRALPRPEQLAAATPQPAPAAGAAGGAPQPESALERRLLSIMERLLGRQGLGVTESFFDVGGDSLLAVQVVLAVERELGRSLPLTGFYDTPNARQLAARLERGEAPGHDAHDGRDAAQHEVIALRAEGSQPPLFCLPGRGGTVFSYRNLAELLEADRPVYGLQFPGLGAGDAPIDSVEELAAELVRRVRIVQPNGPFLFFGYSFGGLVAYEMACQLRDAGLPVPYVAVLDTPVFTSMQPMRPHERAALHLKRFLRTDGGGKLRYVAARLTGALKRLSGKRRSKASLILDEGEELPPGHGEITDALLRLHDAAEEARTHYVPRNFDGRLHLFKTTAPPRWNDHYQPDEYYGWGAQVAAVATYAIPGKHLEAFDPAHVPLLAAQVLSSLAHFT